MYRVLYSYIPRQSDELELIPSDLISVSLECGDGWFVGRSTLTGMLLNKIYKLKSNLKNNYFHA